MTGKPYPQLASALQMLLDRLRRRIRRYVWIEGLAAVLVWIGMTFWASLIVDWFFEPPPAVRMVILAVVGLGLAGLVYQLIVRRLLVPLSDASMALLLERRYPQFNETLLTAVELTALGPDKGSAIRTCWRTCGLATESARDVQLQTVFNPVPLRRNVAVALVLAVAIGGFALQSPQALGVWARRNLLFSQELWPRNTRLSIDGFNGGVVKVARGARFDDRCQGRSGHAASAQRRRGALPDRGRCPAPRPHGS